MSETKKLTPKDIANQLMAEDAWQDTLYVRAEDYDSLFAENEQLRGLLTDAKDLAWSFGADNLFYRIDAALRREEQP